MCTLGLGLHMDGSGGVAELLLHPHESPVMVIPVGGSHIDNERTLDPSSKQLVAVSLTGLEAVLLDQGVKRLVVNDEVLLRSWKDWRRRSR